MLRSISNAARIALAASLLAVAATPTAAPAQTKALTGLSQKDRQTGAQAYKQIVAEFGGTVEGPLSDYVRGVGTRIGMASVPGSTPGDWKVTVLNSPVPNAMATPGEPLALDELDRALLAELHEMADMLTETDTFTPRSR